MVELGSEVLGCKLEKERWKDEDDLTKQRPEDQCG